MRLLIPILIGEELNCRGGLDRSISALNDGIKRDKVAWLALATLEPAYPTENEISKNGAKYKLDNWLCYLEISLSISISAIENVFGSYVSIAYNWENNSK